MQLKYTQRILSNSRPAVENENTDEVVDQAVIDAQPTDAPVEVVTDAEVAVEPTVVDGETVEPEPESTDVPVVEDVPATVVETDEAVDGIDPVEPPQVIPTTDSGEVTIDQVEAVVDGDAETAAEAVVEADADAGVETTVADVIEDAEQAAAEEPTEDAAEGVTDAVADEPSDVVGVADITPEGEVETTDAPVSDAEFNAAEEENTQEEINAAEEAEAEVVPVPVADDAAPAVEDCACEADGENIQPAVVEGDGVAELPVEAQAVEEAAGNNVIDGDVVVEDAVETPVTGVVEPVVEAVVETPLVEDVPEVVPVAGEVVAEIPVDATSEVVDLPVAVEPVATADDGEIDVVDYVPEDQDTAEVLDEALDTYPQIVEVLEGTLENGGISLEAMAILDIFMRRDGISKEPTLALESYNFTSRTQTRVAIESITDDMKTWTAKAIEILKRAIAQFKEFMKARFTQVGALERRAHALSSVDAGKPADGKVEGEFLSALTADGKVDGSFARNYHAFSRDVIGLLGVTSGVIDATGEVHKAVRATVLDKVVNKEESTAEISVGGLMSDIYGKALSHSGAFKKEADGQYVSRLLGGEEFTVLVTGGSWVNEPRFSHTRDDVKVTSAQSLSGKDIAEVSKSTLEIVAALKDSTALADFEKVEADLLQDLERLSKLAANVEAGVNSAALNDLRKYYSNTSTFLNGFVSGLNGVTLRTANAALKYAEASVKAAA